MFTLDKKEVQELNANIFNITQDSPTHKISWVLENSAANMFTILVGNPNKFGHSFFILEEDGGSSDTRVQGPLIYIDNDRSSWENDIFKRNIVKKNHPLSVFCKFPLEIATRIVAANITTGYTVGDIILESLAPYEETLFEGPLFTKDNAYWLNQRIEYLQNIIVDCIHQHGSENVLFPEPWVQSSEDLFLKFFVNNV